MRLSELLAENPMLDHDVEVEDGDVVADLVSLIRVVRLEDHHDGLVIGAPDHTSGIVQYGVVSAARLQVAQWMTSGEDDES